MKPTPRRRGFMTAEAALASSALLVCVALMLPALQSACGACPAPAAGRAARGSAVATRLESVRQHVAYFRMRLVDAYDRRFNDPLPCE